MTKESMLRSLDSIREQIESVIKESPQLLSETPTHDEISDYAAAINEISCAKKDIVRASEYLSRSKKGGDV